MSVRSAAAAGAATRSTWQARPLCGAQWRDVRRAASTARAVGARSVAVHGVQLWLNISDGLTPAAGKQQAISSSRPRRSSTASTPEPEASSGLGAGLNARQRRLARRRLEQQQQVDQARHAGCRLRVVLCRALRYVRWCRVQSEWTAWMRAERAVKEQRRREALGHLRGLLLRAWQRPGATTGPGRLGAVSERDKYIYARAERAWVRFGPEPKGVSAPTLALVECSSAEKRERDRDGASSEASSGGRGLAATALVVISAAAAEEAAGSSTQKTGGRRKQQRGQPSAGVGRRGGMHEPLEGGGYGGGHRSGGLGGSSPYGGGGGYGSSRWGSRYF